MSGIKTMPWVQKRWVSQTEPDIQTMPWVPKKGECHRLYLTLRLCTEFQEKVSVTDCTWHSDYALSSEEECRRLYLTFRLPWVSKGWVSQRLYLTFRLCTEFQKERRKKERKEGECHRLYLTFRLQLFNSTLSSKKRWVSQTVPDIQTMHWVQKVCVVRNTDYKFIYS